MQILIVIAVGCLLQATNSFSTTPMIQQETLSSKGFHHIEFYCGDARSLRMVFQSALGMKLVGESHQGTGNDQCVSYGIVSNNVRMILTAPYSRSVTHDASSESLAGTAPLPGYSIDTAHEWITQHGTFVRAIGIVVENVERAYRNAIDNGAKSILAPTQVCGCQMAELHLYGDVILRLLSDSVASCETILPHLVPPEVTDTTATFGLERMDHIVGNVPILQETKDYVQQLTGYHEFAEFTAEDVGTVESGLNSVVLANDAESILLPLNEPVSGKRKSQIQTYLEQNEGSGVQHVALKTKDIVSTIRKMKETPIGFELMKRPNESYYRELPERLGSQLTEAQYKDLEELGILADADEEGVLLQIFTKPIGDRPTFFFEIIQRIGCPLERNNNVEEVADESHWWARLDERPGCGGFGRGNFKALFKSIEEHEKTLKV